MLWRQAKNNQPCHQGYWTMHWCVHRGKNKYNAVYLLCFHNAVRCILCVCVCPFLCEAGDYFIFGSLHSSLVFHFHLCHYFPISELHLNSTDYTLLLNDHSWGLRIQKLFGWLGPLGLPYITNHIHRWGLSTCKAYPYLDEHKSRENELKGCFLCVSVCLRYCACACVHVSKKNEYIILMCAYVISDTFHALIHTIFSLHEQPSVQVACLPAIWSSVCTWADVCCTCGNACLLSRSTVESTSTRPKVWWRYSLISSRRRTRARTRLSCGTAAPKTSSLWSLWIKVRRSLTRHSVFMLVFAPDPHGRQAQMQGNNRTWKASHKRTSHLLNLDWHSDETMYLLPYCDVFSFKTRC